MDEIWGKSLLREARDEFRAMDEGLPEDEKQSRMSLAHYNAVREAASDMGIGSW
ncbi:hypothetical protein ACIBCC_36730 [Streptomyces griseus]|uniref:hypothetical protein n=1 Tax=Streptomyces griseus TaxID=1911 RepID=UPI0037B10F83